MTTPEIPTQQQTVATDEETHAVTAESTVDTPTTTPNPTALDRGRVAAERVGHAVEHAASAIAGRLRNNAELAEDRGTTTIADEVVEKIAGIAAREVPGVHDLGGEVSRVFASLKERIGLSESDDDEADRGVKVKLEGTEAVVDVTIVIEFGYVVHSVTEAVRTKVISSVENMLGLEVTEVNIRVNDVFVPDNGSENGSGNGAVA